jgi:hypothetical protein
MIVREEPDGSLVLINQTDHAKISGLFAAHWGNGEFARPHPYEPVVRAAIFHDAGWYRYETGPRYDVATGKTPSFIQVPLDAPQIAAFQWSIDWLTEIDPYAGLLINKHRTGLWRGRYGAITHPGMFNARNLNPLVETFIAENEARQKEQERAVDGNEFWINYQLLQLWDLLSLYVCVKPPYDEYIEPVPTGYRDAAGVRVTLKPLTGGKVVIDPYPFDLPSLAIDVPHRRLLTTKFPDEAAFRAAYYQALPQTMRFELVRAA